MMALSVLVHLTTKRKILAKSQLLRLDCVPTLIYFMKHDWDLIANRSVEILVSLLEEKEQNIITGAINAGIYENIAHLVERHMLNYKIIRLVTLTLPDSESQVWKFIESGAFVKTLFACSD